jgi:dsDNA-binding SOS-regulon protein
MTELVKPKITDIAKLEVRHLTKDKVEAERFDKMQEILKNLANPANSLANTDQAKFEELRNKLADASKKGDVGASTILSAASSSSAQPNESQAADLPEGHELSKEQYEEVKKQWVENYKTLPVPEGYTNDAAGRVEWITKDSNDTQDVANSLQTSDKAKNDEALKKISGILPFLLLGGFSKQEMIGYLQAKLDAAKASIQELNEEEASKVSIPTKTNEQQEKAQEVEEKPEENKQ